jgi:hypothetical protein
VAAPLRAAEQQHVEVGRAARLPEVHLIDARLATEEVEPVGVRHGHVGFHTAPGEEGGIGALIRENLQRGTRGRDRLP